MRNFARDPVRDSSLVLSAKRRDQLYTLTFDTTRDSRQTPRKGEKRQGGISSSASEVGTEQYHRRPFNRGAAWLGENANTDAAEAEENG